uniref:uncharacterized protein LOC122611194 n=1 Tax=Erigeron canadensis TaxID=72917 RepID=UPI001CB93640|nr:uncharacterized protein LOC122611194 [Erigeron canadensis]
MNLNEQELSMDFELAEKEHDIFSKSSVIIVDAVPINNVNPMEQELAMSFEVPSEEQNLFIGDTVEDMVPTNHEELDFNLEKHNESATDITFVEEDNQFSKDTNDGINHLTHLSAKKQETLGDSLTFLKGMAKSRNNDENSARKLLGAVVEDDVSKKAEQDKPKSLNEKSLNEAAKEAAASLIN